MRSSWAYDYWTGFLAVEMHYTLGDYGYAELLNSPLSRPLCTFLDFTVHAASELTVVWLVQALLMIAVRGRNGGHQNVAFQSVRHKSSANNVTKLARPGYLSSAPHLVNIA